ncbi:hypothetical protein GCM10009715_43130 [Paeniglutamicibacter psychrophenolicus]|uniref:Uncharacterized protein n=1 Tax=Paeniglutamicibacter psychrophenolicus TaxID=257454 RepID=A0ABS4WJ20_9MICC|nr:hypothetical protein [Paeniglutamicibacter psychrophenolicus]MBP2376183.1 hypothetical protein [Paeniglutamicibacter psychrophenolicus]
MLNTAQNTALVVEMLKYLLSPYLSQSQGWNETIFWESDHGICEATLHDGLAAVVESRSSNGLVTATMGFVAEMLTKNGDDVAAASLLEALFRQLQDNFLLLAEISDEYLGHRVVLKYSRDDEVPSTARGSSSASRRQAPYDQLPNAIDIELPEFATADSFHLEVQVPPGLIITELSLQQYELDLEGGENEISSDSDWSISERSIAHVTLAAKHSLTFARAQVFVMPASQGLVRFTNITVVIIAVIAALGLVEALFPSTILNHKAKPDSSLTSLLLALPAFFLSWMARAPEHTLVAQVLEAHRRVLFFLSLSLFALAAMIAIHLQTIFLEVASLFAGSMILWAILQLTYLHFSMQSERRTSMLGNKTSRMRVGKDRKHQ